MSRLDVADLGEGGVGGIDMSWLYNYESWLYDNWYPFRAISPLVNYDQTRSTKLSNQTQIDYSEYMKAGNERALKDWNKYVGSQGKTIRYPEFSYSGNIRGYDAGITRSNLSNYSADANLYRSTFYGTAGLYGVAGRVARSL